MNNRVAALMYNLRLIGIGVRHVGVIHKTLKRHIVIDHSAAVHTGRGYAQNVPELMRYFDSVVHRK